MAKPRPSRPMTHGEVRTWLKAHRTSLRSLARAIQREPSLVSRVVRGQVSSAPVWYEILTYMDDPNTYVKRRLAWARRVLRRDGLLA